MIFWILKHLLRRIANASFHAPKNIDERRISVVLSILKRQNTENNSIDNEDVTLNSLLHEVLITRARLVLAVTQRFK